MSPTQFWTYMEFRLACFMFFWCPVVDDSLVFSRSARTLRINSPRQSTEYMAGSVLALGIRVWNSFPVSTKSSSSLQGFSRIVRDVLWISYWVFVNGYCYFFLSTPMSFNLSLSPFFQSSLNFISLSYLFLSFLLSLYSLSHYLFFLIMCPFLYSGFFISSTLITLIL
jgi:hypothetical protein